MISIPFTKMVGTGNDFLLVDARVRRLASLRHVWPQVGKALCDRRHGVGADGLLVLEPSNAADVRMHIFNPDGSEAEMCGNGARCVALYLKAQRWAGDRVTIETRAGGVEATVRGPSARFGMSPSRGRMGCCGRVAMRLMDPTALRPKLQVKAGGRTFRAGFIDTGVPHLVVPVKGLDGLDVVSLGRALRHHRAFAPRGANVNFIQADPSQSNRLRVRTYERGVEDETLACGTGLVASAVLYALSRYQNAGRSSSGTNGHRHHHWTIDVVPRSSDLLRVSFSIVPQGPALRIVNVVMEGEAVRVFDGTVDWPPRRT